MFEFATATRIIFGRGQLKNIQQYLTNMGQNALVITGSNPNRATPLLEQLDAAGITYQTFAVSHEPTIELMDDAIDVLKSFEATCIISMGGGSVIDAGKAIAALATNPGGALDYLEVIGDGKPLKNAPLPFVAIPTTAGTGAEVTKNAVLASRGHQVKVSLRHPMMLPLLALVDPELTYSVPAHITAYTGMDALTQVIEPYVSRMANPITDALAREGIQRAANSLRQVYENGQDEDAREDMMLAGLLGGLALANAKLGAVHGFAGALGGMYDAPHGAVCAALLPHSIAMNVRIINEREPENPILRRFDEVGQMLTGDKSATAQDAVAWIQDTAEALNIQSLQHYGIQKADFPEIIEKSARSSSMKGNPITLTSDNMHRLLSDAY